MAKHKPKLAKRLTRDQQAIREQWLALSHSLMAYGAQANGDDNLARELSDLQREMCNAFFAQGDCADYGDVLHGCAMVRDIGTCLRCGLLWPDCCECECNYCDNAKRRLASIASLCGG